MPHCGFQALIGLWRLGKLLRKITLFLPDPSFRGVCGKSCSWSPGWSKELTWSGDSSSRLGVDVAMGCMQGLAVDTREVHSQVCVLLGCVKFYFEKKLRLIQMNCSQRCLFCSTGWDRVWRLTWVQRDETQPSCFGRFSFGDFFLCELLNL